jgi:glycosyltransferase involved in cell wall biosynthesis
MSGPGLHIGVDGRELLGRPTGVGRYLAEILGAWIGDPTWPHRLTIFVPSSPGDDLRARFPNVAWHVVASTSTGTRWEQMRLPRAITRAGVDVFFAAGYTAPLRLACPFVVAIYDVSFFAHPEWFGWREGLRRRWITRSAARRARRVVTISEFSAREIVRWIGIRRDAIAIAPPGAPPLVDDGDAGPREPIVLFVGSLFNRRRIPDLISAFAAAAGDVPNARLVLAGDNRTSPRIDPRALASTTGVGDRVEWRAYVTDAELAELYGRARVFAFLSDYEGFAMTPMEALARGVAPALLDTPVAREVYEGAAMFVPDDPTAIGAALRTLLIDDAARRRLVEAGRERLRAFSWRQAAATIRTALEEAVRS